MIGEVQMPKLRHSTLTASGALGTKAGAAVAHPSDREDMHASHAPRGGMTALTIGALGVVYGDIGTSPLYAVNEIFFGHGHVAPTPGNVRGCISLVLWALTVVVGFKYIVFVLRADNDGEGGVFALYGLLHKYKRRGAAALVLLSALMLGAGLVFGDGIITPAISVLSAVEGIKVATPMFAGAVVPVTVVILTALFAIQYKGTARVGRVFGPVLICWFVAIGALGARQIAHQPEILQALSPMYGARFLRHAGLRPSLLVLGALMLVVTGGEALYADMGHFGARPIRAGWFALVYPALLLNYLGQGALLVSEAPVVGGQLFFSLVPRAMLLLRWWCWPPWRPSSRHRRLSPGAFSLASQAMALGLFPRLRIVHTHHAHAGQIYMPFVNWALYLGAILLVATFRSSSALASAYGLAVSGVMVATSVAMFPVGKLYWKWSVLRSGLLFGALAAVDVSFLMANSLKFLEGGFIPFSLGLALFGVMVTWRWGRKSTFAAYSAKHTMTMAELVRLHRRARSLPGAQRPADGAQAAALRARPHAGATATAMGPLRSFAPQPDIRRSDPSQGALRARRPLPGDGLPARPAQRQHHQRDAEFRLHGGPQRRARAGGIGQPSGNRPADRRAQLDRARFSGKPPALQSDEPRHGASGCGCLRCCATSRNPPITTTDWATRYNSRPRSCRCA